MRDDKDISACGTCLNLKPSTAFGRLDRQGDQRDYMCGECRSATHRAHFLEFKTRAETRSSKRSRQLARERTAHLIGYFDRHSCSDCGESDPVALQLDHSRVGAGAPDDLAPLSLGHLQAIVEEIAECDVVCADCSRWRAAKRSERLRSLFSDSRNHDA